MWGGSGGGRRSPLCLENAPDAFDGALPFMGGGNIMPFPATDKVKSGQPIAFACMFNVQRLLRDGDKPARLVDAMQPGGSGNPFVGLNSHEREELVYLYEQGFPFGDEHMIFSPMGQMWLWTSIADLLVEQDPTYFTNFWTEPGLHRSRPAVGGGGRPHRRRHHGEQGDHRARPHDRSGLRGARSS